MVCIFVISAAEIAGPAPSQTSPREYDWNVQILVSLTSSDQISIPMVEQKRSVTLCSSKNGKIKLDSLLLVSLTDIKPQEALVILGLGSCIQFGRTPIELKLAV